MKGIVTITKVPRCGKECFYFDNSGYRSGRFVEMYCGKGTRAIKDSDVQDVDFPAWCPLEDVQDERND